MVNGDGDVDEDGGADYGAVDGRLMAMVMLMKTAAPMMVLLMDDEWRWQF